MPVIVGISLRTAGKLCAYDPGTQRYYIGERVLVETARGLEMGTVKLPPHETSSEEIGAPIKPVLRRATAADIVRDTANREREDQALTICKRLVTQLNLPMNLIDAQYSFDCSHLLIHFLAENRVDFRELVRELAHEVHARIELRQVGVRDEAKLIGGYGICGRQLCCSAFLGDFAPVSISMAKDQDLALNPQKISGSCGRLMCCLAFECGQYRDERANLPRLNATVETPSGIGKVTKLNVMARMVEVMLPEDPMPVWFSADELLGNFAAKSCCRNGTCAAHSRDAVMEVVEDELEDMALLNEDGRMSDLPVGERLRMIADDIPAIASTPARLRRNKPPFSQQGQNQPAAKPPAPPRAQGELPAASSANKRKRHRKPQAKAPGVAPTPAAQPGTAAPTGSTPPPRNRSRHRRRPAGDKSEKPPEG